MNFEMNNFTPENIPLKDTPEVENDILKNENDEPRKHWANQLDFLFSIIGFAVDLSNVFRFPYICFLNGGGAFLIPYFIMLLFCALPMFYLELLFGQYMRCGGLTIWKLCPLFKGVGYASVMLNFFVALYYNVIIAWSLYYLFASFSPVLPWKECGMSWNTKHCYQPFLNFSNKNATIHNNLMAIDPATEYLENKVLMVDHSTGIDDLGPLKWDITLTLLLLYIIIYLCLFKGVKFLGKAVWVTAILPYVVLGVLLIRGLMLEGAMDGIKYFITPNFKALLTPDVWIAAATQIFFSVGVGFSVHIAYASYNDFHSPIHRDCLIAAAVNSFTSLFSGFVVFTYLGYMSYTMGKPIQLVVNQNPTLIFVVYPQALATLPGSQFWSVMFFIMLFSLGLDSSFGALEALLTGILDEFDFVFKKLKYKREIMTAIMLIILYFFSLPNTTYGGFFLIQLYDKFSAGTSLLAVSLLECIGFVWIYGIDNIVIAVQKMNNFTLHISLRILMKYITPVFIFAITVAQVFSVSGFEVSLGRRKFVYPKWSLTFGLILSLSSILCIPIFAIAVLFRIKSQSFKERMCLAISPTWEHKAISSTNVYPRFSIKHWTTV